MPKRFKKLNFILTWLFTLGTIGILLSTIGAFAVVYYFSQDLPDYRQLESYNPPTVTRLYAKDGQMLAEYATEKRLYVPISAIPKRLIHAFIAAEDKNFYTHPGIDVVSIARAAMQNVIHYGKNRSLVGGSTITQQVVKNFLLTNEKSLTRKIKEAILAFRITQAFSKDRILELYLNEIYLGGRSYGVAAAALNYFNKSITELTIEEAALLAAMPKAPSTLDPRRYPERAKTRRDWVIGRMEEEGFINDAESLVAASTPITLGERDKIQLVNATFFADSVKQKLIDLYDEKEVMEGGLAVRTTLEPELQRYAENALINGLINYDRRHGWRGALKNTNDVAATLESMPSPATFMKWSLAGVLNIEPTHADILLKNGETGQIWLKDLKWARQFVDRNTLGPRIKSPSQVLKVGDIIVVSEENLEQSRYALEQLPEINGSIVAMDPHNGRVKAMVGGYYYGSSQFNRATQAKRQPGSAFKPFVYMAALENGMAPNSIIVDEEIQLEQGEDEMQWKPQNHSGKYYGPTTLRIGMEKSRNAMTVRLAQHVGISKVVEIAKRFNIHPQPERNFAMVLGADQTNLLDLTNAYAMIVNGGKNIRPALIERIQNNDGQTLFRRDSRLCANCNIADVENEENNLSPDTIPQLEDMRQQLIDEQIAFQMTSMLEGVIKRGTGRGARRLGKVLAGKTGTTNDSFDAWFLGFSADLVVGVYAGFDTPQSLGKHEYGSSVALPIWRDFMKQALGNTPDIPFRQPDGMKLVKVDITSGALPSPQTPKNHIIFEAFRDGQTPNTAASHQLFDQDDNDAILNQLGTGGVY